MRGRLLTPRTRRRRTSPARSRRPDARAGWRRTRALRRRVVAFPARSTATAATRATALRGVRPRRLTRTRRDRARAASRTADLVPLDHRREERHERVAAVVHADEGPAERPVPLLPLHGPRVHERAARGGPLGEPDLDGVLAACPTAVDAMSCMW